MLVAFTAYPTENTDGWLRRFIGFNLPRLDRWLGKRKKQQHNLTFMAMTDKVPITLTVSTDENNRETIEYKIDNKGHLIEK